MQCGLWHFSTPEIGICVLLNHSQLQHPFVVEFEALFYLLFTATNPD